MPSKGVQHPYPAKRLLRDLDYLGYGRVVIRSDQENAIRALVKSVKDGWAGEATIEHAPKGESKSNGEVERAVQNIQGIARTLREHLEIHSGAKVGTKSPVAAWLVEYSGTLYNLFHKGDDGMTPFMRNRGRPWKVDLPPFGEKVDYLKRTRHKLESRWAEGIFLGVKEETTENRGRLYGDLRGPIHPSETRGVQV